MARQTVVMYHNYDADKMKALESDPTKEIISKKVETYDAVHLLPLHHDPKPQFLLHRVTYVYRDVIPVKKSSSQDALSRRSTSLGRAPKTLDDTNEFISAFWVNGKPKCRKGYTYDFRRKMCRLIK